MKIFLLIILAIAISSTIQAQDTLYSQQYPKGIIVKSIDPSLTGYRFFPVGSPDMEVFVYKKETSKICYHSGEVFVNNNYKPKDEVAVLSSDRATGKIYYSNVLEFKDAGISKLYGAVKTIPNSTIKYTLTASDEKDYSYQKFNGETILIYENQPYRVSFNLLVKFKDNRIKYEYTDFVAVFEKKNVRTNIVGDANVVQLEKRKTLDQFYATGDLREQNNKKFWTPLRKGIEQSIESIRTQCSNASGDKNDW